jgi:phospho-N-acetylmuramoyl-pentapeptide-transferase
MITELLKYLDAVYNFPGARLGYYLSFRSIAAALTAGFLGWLVGPWLIGLLRRKAFGEVIRTDGPASHASKKGTPTMGGLLILLTFLGALLLWGEWHNAYLLALAALALWLGLIGWVDDYLKLRRSKKGLSARVKLLGQVGGAFLLWVLMISVPDFYSTAPRVDEKGRVRLSATLREAGLRRGDHLLAVESTPFSLKAFKYRPFTEASAPTYYVIGRGKDTLRLYIPPTERLAVAQALFGESRPHTLTQTNLPFYKNQLLEYARLGTDQAPLWLQTLFYGFVILFIVTATSNAYNLTDGLDGLAAGVGVISFVSLGAFAYFSSNKRWADYFQILYLPHASEVTIVCAALVGGLVAFLWYNAYPAQIFMGDTGSLMVGGLLGAVSLMIKKELLLPLIAGISFAETVSVMIQVAYFRYTRRRYGEGRRIFRMAPLHHHYELLGWHEVKVVIRFWIVALLLNALAFITLKLR